MHGAVPFISVQPSGELVHGSKLEELGGMQKRRKWRQSVKIMGLQEDDNRHGWNISVQAFQKLVRELRTPTDQETGTMSRDQFVHAGLARQPAYRCTHSDTDTSSDI
jgi:hypothetical protein